VTVQQMCEIAARHRTAMADAMLAACLAWSARSGVALSVPEREAPELPARPADVTQPGKKWHELVVRNSDTRWLHM